MILTDVIASIQTVVAAFESHELTVGAVLNNASVVHHDDLVGIAYC